MRELFLSTMVSLDGYTAGPGGDLQPFEVDDDEVERYFADQLGEIDAMLFGRVSYELLAGYWPGAESDANPLRAAEARLMNTIPKLVVSRGTPELAWGPARRVGADLATEIAELKRQPGKDIALFAGASAMSAVERHDLVDEYRLVVFPVLLGDGVPLFPLQSGRRALRFAGITRFDRSGVVALRYRRETTS